MRTTWLFSSRMSFRSLASSRLSWAMAFANAFSASERVRPWAALTSASACARLSSTVARLFFVTTRAMSFSSESRSPFVGSGTSTTDTSFSSSSGSFSVGATTMAVVNCVLRWKPSSRSARTVTGSSRWRWKSFSSTSAGFVSR